jgi:hypothetical protein
MPCPDFCFPVRHFSPAGAVLVERWLDERNPDVVLIEAPADASSLFGHLVHELTKPPVAVLAFTTTRPVRSLVFPFAVYSPEWVALRWALDRKRPVRGIDLPSMAFLEHFKPEEIDEDVDDEEADSAADEDDEADVEDDAVALPADPTQALLDDPHEAIARIAGDLDHDAWWERSFESLDDPEAYRQAAFALGQQLRAVAPRDDDLTVQREAHMRWALDEARITKVKGKLPVVAVICGAYHAPALEAPAALPEAAVRALPKAQGVLTLMPYSYERLSRQAGYGAGNQAPHWFEQRYWLGVAGQLASAPARHLAEVAGHLRREGQMRSSAEVIEAVRLAQGLASLQGGPAPVLAELRDAATTCLGQGDARVVAKALHAVEVGHAVGALPPGVSRTALQDDFHAAIIALKLERWRADKEQTLELDLREDRSAKTAAAAFRDRDRSTFLNRLAVLNIGFGATVVRPQHGTSKEAWRLRWTPDCEIRLAEASLVADSIEHATAFALSERLAAAEDVGQATAVLLQAADCQLADALGQALIRVQALSVEEAAFPAAAAGIADLAILLRYGSVRAVDPAPLRPILAQLHLRACLLLFGATVCDDAAAQQLRLAIDRIHEATFLGEEGVDPEQWLDAVRTVSASDSRHPFLSGYATGLLIERGRIDDEALDREVARRLSPGTEAGIGVAWFEGLVQRNRAALFMRRALWDCLARYVDDLDDEAFRRALLYLRRAFATFPPGEIRRVVAILAELWQDGGAELAKAVERPLDAAEVAQTAADLDGLDLL